MRREGTERQRKTERTQGSSRVIRAEEGAREKAPEDTWAEARGVGQGCPFFQSPWLGYVDGGWGRSLGLLEVSLFTQVRLTVPNLRLQQ